MSFTGPLFIIGMPRSGTKLLRNLLNNHPLIGIPKVETNFLPTLFNEWSNFGDLSKKTNFLKFFRYLQLFSYFSYLAEENKLIPCNTWYSSCHSFTLSDVYEALIRHDTNTPYNSTKIWGDKSPNYIRHIPLLNKLFPEARFIHIIRDVRDYCLSINNAWGKNMLRAAQRWRFDVKKANIDGIAFRNNYYEIKYENLISNTNSVLKNICKFLSIDYFDNMHHFVVPVENLGDALDYQKIKKDNFDKYKFYEDVMIIRKIESIAADILIANGYNVNYSEKIDELSYLKMNFYKIMDAFNYSLFNFKDKGYFRALKWNLKHLIIYIIKMKITKLNIIK